MPWWSILIIVIIVIYLIAMIVLFFVKKKNGTLGACGDCPHSSSCHGQCGHQTKNQLLDYYNENKNKTDKKDDK